MNQHPSNQCTFPSQQKSNPPKYVPTNGTICIYQIHRCILPCLVHYQHQLKLINFSLTLRDTPLAQSSIYLTAFVLVFPLIMYDLVVIFHLKIFYPQLTILRPLTASLTEVVLGRIVGPFDALPFSVFHISPLGLIPKKAPGEFHLIHHLSFPEGQSVNSHIPKIASSVHYANIDDAILVSSAHRQGLCTSEN